MRVCSSARSQYGSGGFPAMAGFSVILLMLLFLAPNAFSQARFIPTYVEPKWFTFRLSEVSAGIYAEGVSDQRNFKNSGITVSHEHLFIGPLLGFSANGSIYHPNLLTYAINSEGAFGWNHDAFSAAGTHSSRNELDYMGRFSASAD